MGGEGGGEPSEISCARKTEEVGAKGGGSVDQGEKEGVTELMQGTSEGEEETNHREKGQNQGPSSNTLSGKDVLM